MSFRNFAPSLAVQVEGDELLLELLGLIGNLRLRRIPELASLVARYGFIEFLQRQLVPGFAEDDVLLEVRGLVQGMS
eukprot:5048139-Pleurochrysis_carterae.AAC.1